MTPDLKIQTGESGLYKHEFRIIYMPVIQDDALGYLIY